MSGPDRQIMSVFGEAVEYKSPEARAAFLDQACAGNASRRERVDALLRAHEAAGNLLQGQATACDAALRLGLRGLPGGSSLARLLAARRGVRNHLDLPPLTVTKVLAWADRYRAVKLE